MRSHAGMSSLPLRSALKHVISNLVLKVLGHRASAEPPNGDILDALSRIAEDRPRCPKMAPRWPQDGSKMRPEGLLGPLGGLLGLLGGLLGGSWEPLGGIWGHPPELS